MKRRWLSVIGGFFLLTATGLAVALVRAEEFSNVHGLTAGLLGLVGLLFVIAGEGRSVAGFEWNQLGGMGHIILGCWFAFQAGTFVPQETGSVELILIGAFVLGGLVFVFIGVDWFRGGRHFDVTSLEPGRLRADRDTDGR